MNPRPLLLAFAAALAAACSPASDARVPLASPTPRAILTQAQTAAIHAQRADDAPAREALAGIARGDTWDASALAAHPLAGWVEFAELNARIREIDPARGDGFLQRQQGQPVAEVFRGVWLTELARRGDWAAFRRSWSSDVTRPALRCAELRARLETGADDELWRNDALALWQSAGSSLPDDCNPVFNALGERHALTADAVWTRIEAAAAELQPGVMLAAARRLSGHDAELARDMAAFIDSPHDRAGTWPRDARSRLIASHGLARLARTDPDQAERRLAQLDRQLALSEDDRGRVLYQIALWSVASLDGNPAATRRFAAVPASAWDASLHEWQVREALSRGDWNGTRAAIARMPAEQRDSARWTWFNARAHEALGQRERAEALYRAAAGHPEFHGFLAADKLDAPYVLCPLQLNPSPAMQAEVAADPALQRALALQRLDRAGWAAREWADAASRFTPAQRHVAVAMAQAQGWFDRGLFGLVNVGGVRLREELRLYELRFPLHHDATIRREAARNGLDPAWVAAQTRAESMFDPSARSPADARGLMQILPATGAAVAGRIGQPWGGAQSLYDAETNIVLGTAYLNQLMDRYARQPYKVIAAYNAGPTPVGRWQAARGHMDPDVWIETVTYRETRDYVARVLAYSAIYDWRLDGEARRVSDRLLGRIDGPRKAFVCPADADAPVE
ncbi:MAG: transglycosylase SLT domain-containing protein [Pseudoxanthomonas suwonensis]|nr:transglycosylase SLT domain-containing protein [Pseudoxanthomonas suwonensis]